MPTVSLHRLPERLQPITEDDRTWLDDAIDHGDSLAKTQEWEDNAYDCVFTTSEDWNWMNIRPKLYSA